MSPVERPRRGPGKLGIDARVMKQPVAVVTGASRGVGRGVAAALLSAGYRVFATGRFIDSADLPAGVERIVCDHLWGGETDHAFEFILSEAGQIDVLVNCAWGGYEQMVEDGRFSWQDPFWKQPPSRWIGMMDTGVRSAWMCAARAAPAMVAAGQGLIVNLGFWAAQSYLGNALYGAAKAATDKLSADMAVELRPHGVAAISLYPGLVRTESVVEAAKSGAFDLSNSESPEFIGRVIVALHASPNLMEYSGRVVVAAAVAREFGVVDIDGKSPAPLELANINPNFS